MLCNYPLSVGDTLGLQAGHSSTQPSVWCCVISPQWRCNTDVQMTHHAKLIPPLDRHWLGFWTKSHNDVHFYVRSRLKSGLAPLPPLASHRHSSKCACWSLSPRGQNSFVSAAVVAFQHFPLHVIYSRVPYGDWDQRRSFLETGLKNT